MTDYSDTPRVNQHFQGRDGINPAIVDLFAGPGGWDEALASLGRHDVLGIEYDEPCCRTREAAGHATRHANVAEVDPIEYAGIEGLIASPPCQAWSVAGNRGAVTDQPLVYWTMEQMLAGRDVRAKAREDAVDERSLLVAEPLRWALALRPRWICLEQVEPVAGLWAWMAEKLRGLGYSAWSGVLSAERYGVPQTRKRAFLIASLDEVVSPPLPTHQAYRYGEPAEHTVTLEGELLPWISMADALGWGFNEQPAPTVSGGGRDNGIGVFAGQNQRERLRAVVRAGGDPAKAQLSTGRDWKPDGTSQHIDIDQPAPALTGKAGGQWAWRRPATTVCGDPRVMNPGGHHTPGAQSVDAVKITVPEALLLQSFRPDYPVQGNQGQRYQQVGNAVPPLLAKAVLTSVIPARQEADRVA